jgi:RNA polymerase sigma-70 factor (ECF subfamily)
MSDESTPVDDRFQQLVEALRHRDNNAWNEVARRYTAGLIGLARRRLDSRLQPKLDPEDVVQSVYRTFLRRHQLEQFQFATWESLWGLLVTLTVCRCSKWYQHYAAQKRDVNRDARLPAGAATGDDEQAGYREPADPGPTPQEAALLTEMVNEMLRGLDDKQRRIIVLGLLGFDDAQIGQEVGRTEYRVRQVRDGFIGRVQEVLAQEPEPARL